MGEAKNKLLGLFRSRSTSERPSKDSDSDDDRKSTRRPSTSGRSRHHSPQSQSAASPPSKGERRHKHRERHNEGHKERHKDGHREERRRKEEEGNGRRMSVASEAPSIIQALPLREWPPPELHRNVLSQGKAMELIASGAPAFKGSRRTIAHSSEEYYNLFAVCEGNGSAGSDCAEPFNGMYTVNSFRLQGPERPTEPWETLEQPSMSFCYGLRPGTCTLTFWVGLSGNPSPPIELREPDMRPREVELSTILDRLKYLEGGFEEDYEDLMYTNLYKKLLKDPEKILSPHKGMEKQIADLIIVLSRREWIDFSKPGNQVVAKFFANAAYTDQGRYKLFFHQLLLSVELDLRIHSKQHSESAKAQLLSQLPPCISWNLALARRWRDCMTIEKFETGADPEQIKFRLKSKKLQVKSLHRFSRAMKWPNLAQVDKTLRETDPSAERLEDRSSDAMSYFTGVILPGTTLPWLIMNTLIDCDDGIEANALAALTHIHPNSGFQYRGVTYWSSTSIVGKVLAPTCREVAGWVGPALPTPDLPRLGIGRIRQRRPKQTLTPNDVTSMMERSDPLGPPADSYPVEEYKLLFPDEDDLVDIVRVETLSLKAVSPNALVAAAEGRPLVYDSCVQFAIDGKSWPLRLTYDVSFIFACPCARGPHPLFFDYVYKEINVSEILTIRDWGGNFSRSGSGESKSGSVSNVGDDDSERVLVINAFGVADNEVLARAWCSHWGLSAVVFDLEKTCMACAIREAYAACVNVCIIVEGMTKYDDDWR